MARGLFTWKFEENISGKNYFERKMVSNKGGFSSGVPVYFSLFFLPYSAHVMLPFPVMFCYYCINISLHMCWVLFMVCFCVHSD